MTDAAVAAFADQFHLAAQAYLDAMRMRSRTIRLGTRNVRVSVPDVDMAHGISPLSGLLPPTAPPVATDFELVLFDHRGPLGLPIGRWPSSWHAPLGVVRDYRSAPVRIALDRHTQTVSVFDPGTRRCIVWTYDTTLYPYWAAATPFRLHLSWMADTFDAEMLHAAAIGRDGKALLLVGPSGAGKSTAALQAREHGFDLVGDDFVLGTTDHVHSVYGRAKLHDTSLPAVSSTGFDVLNPATEEKRILDLDPAPTATAEISATVVPMLGTEPGWEPISPGQAFARLAPPSLSGLLGGNRRSLLRLRRIVENRPAFRWVIAKDRAADMAVLEDLWSRVA